MLSMEMHSSDGGMGSGGGNSDRNATSGSGRPPRTQYAQDDTDFPEMFPDMGADAVDATIGRLLATTSEREESISAPNHSPHALPANNSRQVSQAAETQTQQFLEDERMAMMLQNEEYLAEMR